MIYVLDLDGTLIDSRERHYRLMWEILSEKVPETVTGIAPEGILEKLTETGSGKRFDPVEFMEYKADGHSGKKYLLDLLGLPEDTASQIMESWRQQIEEEQWLEFDTLYQDAPEFLNQLRQKHIMICYLTARQNKKGLLQELERLRIADYADEIQAVSPSGAGEEKKRAVERLLKKTGEKVNSVCIVGDTENEYHLAEELSLPCCLLNRGFRSKRFWEERGVKSIASLCEIDTGCGTK